MSTDLVLDALEMAIWRRDANSKGLVAHSDAGNHYTAIRYTERLGEIGAAPSIGTVGDSYDKGFDSHCTSWCWSGGNSPAEVASLTFDETLITWSGSIEQPGVAVVGLVAGNVLTTAPLTSILGSSRVGPPPDLDSPRTLVAVGFPGGPRTRL